MKHIFLLIFILCCLSGCSSNHITKKQNVEVSSKEGESCLIDQKCKMIVSRYEQSSDGGLFDIAPSGKVYYKCIVSNDLYNATVVKDGILLNLTKCEKISQE